MGTSGVTRQTLIVTIATMVTAATRVWGVARSPWDWDEILFSLALRHYDVALHHPHPPGFPLFIAAAKLLRVFTPSDFRSLQAVNVVAGVLLVPATYFLCRELGFRFSTSLIAALFLAFFPNVWFFGETAFSDVPSMVLVVFACALLLRGRRSDHAYFWGAVVLAFAGAMRPQNLVIGLAPLVIATWHRRKVWLTVAGAIVACVIVFGSYATAAHASGGWQRYREAIRAHQQYITQTDSFLSPTRPPLHHLLDDFFVRPYHAPMINFCVTALALLSAAASIVRRRAPALIAMAAFAPFCLAAWLFLDHFSASRFSIGYAPLIAILAADGLALLSQQREWIEWTLGLALTILMFIWTLPAIDLARRSDSPPLRAIDWIRAHVDPASSILIVHEGMGPYAEYFLDRYRIAWTLDGPPIARLDPTPGWYVEEGMSDQIGAMNFSWPRRRAWDIARRRYFEVSVLPLNATPRFTGGWYDEESSGKSVWRWMGARGTIELPPVKPWARLRMRIFVPLHVMPETPTITIRMNGAAIAELHPKQPFTEFVHDFGAESRTLEIETDRVVNPLRRHLGEDPRDLGLRLDQLEWIALER
ncbi:MAG TPA: glycosyltransferase family 39 protein [Thermoanaerobaculia bacterium]